MNFPHETKLQLQDLLPYADVTPEENFSHGVVREVMSWVVLASGLYITYLLTDYSPLLVVPSFYIVCAVAGEMRERGIRLRINTRNKILSDHRKPILYLRPFLNDKPMVRVDLSIGGEGISITERASDGTLARVLNAVGPMVAVGGDKGSLPPTGAIRLYFNNEEWREKVTALIAISEFVIIQPGYTDNLEWELIMAKSGIRADQLIISLLDWKNMKKDDSKVEYEIFAMQIKRVCGVTLPRFNTENLFISFDNEWSATTVRLDGDMNSLIFMPYLITRVIPLFDGPIKSVAIREALRPIMHRRGIRLSTRKTIIDLGIAYLISAAFIFYAIVLLLKMFGK